MLLHILQNLVDAGVKFFYIQLVDQFAFQKGDDTNVDGWGISELHVDWIGNPHGHHIEALMGKVVFVILVFVIFVFDELEGLLKE